jgi:DNA-binding MarR family transcriptional regulator
MASNRYAAAAEFRAELRRFLKQSEDCARAHGLTPRQHLLLLQIAAADGGQTTVSQLVSTLALTQSAVTELVQRAESAGLVTRSPSKRDGRVALLSLTATGQERLDAVHDALGAERAQLHRVVGSLGDDIHV